MLKNKIISISIFLYIALTTNFVYAQAAWWEKYIGKSGSSQTTVATVFANADSALRVAIAGVSMFSAIVGVILFIIAANKAVRASDGKEPVSHAIYALISGTFLVAFTPAIDMLSTTIGSNGTTAGLAMVCEFTFDGCPPHQDLQTYSKAAIVGIISFFRLLGYIAVFKGFYGIYELSKGNSQKSVWSYITYIIGGIACINVILLTIIVANQVAPKSAFSNFLKDNNTGLVTAINPFK